MNFDERTQQVAGYSAMIMLGLTQVALGAVILIRLYIFDQPDEDLRDFQFILLGSIVGYFFLRSWLGGIMPVPTAKQALLAFVVMTFFLYIVLSAWLGVPKISEWKTTILPATIGPAIIVGGYWTIAALGKRRLEQQIAE